MVRAIPSRKGVSSSEGRMPRSLATDRHFDFAPTYFDVSNWTWSNS